MPYPKNIIIIIFIVLSMQANAQTVKVDAKLDTNQILIGDQVGFTIRLQIPKSEAFIWPMITDTLPEKLEIVKTSKIDTTQVGNDYLNIEQKLTLTVFDSGYYVIKPIRFFFGTDYAQSIETEPYLLNVFTVDVDTTLSIKPIKGPMAAPVTLAEILPWVLTALLVLILSGLAVYFLKKKKNKQPVTFLRPKPKIPVHKIALDKLDKLKKEKLWQQDLIKAYYTQLTDIIREYIEERFKITAIEMTTWEIIRSFAGAKIEQANLIMLREILEEADLVKFAKHKPLPDMHEKSMSNAVAFVLQTMNEQRDNINNIETEATIAKPELNRVFN